VICSEIELTLAVGDRQFLKLEGKTKSQKKNKYIAATEKTTQIKMLYTPPWHLRCGHPGRCQEEDWKYLVPHLSTHKAKCSGPVHFSSQTHKMAAEMGAAVFSTEAVQTVAWWQEVRLTLSPTLLQTVWLPPCRFLSRLWQCTIRDVVCVCNCVHLHICVCLASS